MRDSLWNFPALSLCVYVSSARREMYSMRTQSESKRITRQKNAFVALFLLLRLCLLLCKESFSREDFGENERQKHLSQSVSLFFFHLCCRKFVKKVFHDEREKEDDYSLQKKEEKNKKWKTGTTTQICPSAALFFLKNQRVFFFFVCVSPPPPPLFLFSLAFFWTLKKKRERRYFARGRAEIAILRAHLSLFSAACTLTTQWADLYTNKRSSSQKVKEYAEHVLLLLLSVMGWADVYEYSWYCFLSFGVDQTFRRGVWIVPARNKKMSSPKRRL